jgi:transposase
MAQREVVMSNNRYPEEFKIEVVKQVTDQGYSVADVPKRLGTTTHSLHALIKRYGPYPKEHQAKAEAQAEIKRLKTKLKCITKERDIQKKAAMYFASHTG